ncbi:MAG: peptide chain release factor N(5)-glutamine methyltransferase [Sulfurimonas sp.]|nr:MAG: peptide chain release factor N(5)-glutamine methyltransferase [Sulfurimonas sp.]
MSDTRTLNEWVEWIALALKDIACASPRREAELLLRAFFKQDQLWLMSEAQRTIEATPLLMEWIQRRASNEPLEYLCREVSFYSRNFFIQPGALIPRPETELLVEQTLLQVDSEAVLTVVEVGIGSGIISIVLAQHMPNAHFIGIDISNDALAVARHNIARYGLEDRIELRQGDLLCSVCEPIDVLVSNPPYIANHTALEPNLAYEPDTALFGGEVGDEMIQKLLEAVQQRHIPLFTCEIGYDQKTAIEAYLSDFKIQSLEFYSDYAGFDRGLILRLENE